MQYLYYYYYFFNLNGYIKSCSAIILLIRYGMKTETEYDENKRFVLFPRHSTTLKLPIHFNPYKLFSTQRFRQPVSFLQRRIVLIVGHIVSFLRERHSIIYRTYQSVRSSNSSSRRKQMSSKPLIQLNRPQVPTYR